VALGKPEVQKAFSDANVVLMRADWTRYDDNITRALNSFGRSGVPTYVLYAPGDTQPRVLPEVLTPGIVTDAISQLPHSSTQSAAAASNHQ
jgi:thiol:disulfide interchange protein DsbD